MINFWQIICDMCTSDSEMFSSLFNKLRIACMQVIPRMHLLTTQSAFIQKELC